MIRIGIYTIFSCLIALPALGQSLPSKLFSTINKVDMQRWADSVYRNLNERERLAQLIMPIVFPSALEERIQREEQRLEQHPWGGILYQKGLMSEQLTMNERLQKASNVPLLIALDGEWGLYMRLKDAPEFPRNLGLARPENESLLYRYGQEIARECRLMGIHVNFAPSVDVQTNPRNPVIGSRSFGANPSLVARLAGAYARGLEEGNVLSVAKHFPGHGDTHEDSHKTLPSVSASRARLDSVELLPFRSYIASGFGGIMIAHLRIPVLEPEELPSSLSQAVVADLLKNQMGFNGLIFTDALEMKGVQTNKVQDIGVSALLAGCDILLGPIHAEAQLEALVKAYRSGQLSPELVKDRVMKLLYYKYCLIISKPQTTATPKTVHQLIWTDTLKQLHREMWLEHQRNSRPNARPSAASTRRETDPTAHPR